ncbi:hypothetical protein Z052_04935 [Halorubrum sp. C191]|nr:hypothetical protein DJ84_02555 [Halorubrum ezzemoulense]PHQ43279.1 hypothetical protein Z052_04935 [Halorubrum sp. C191]
MWELLGLSDAFSLIGILSKAVLAWLFTLIWICLHITISRFRFRQLFCITVRTLSLICQNRVALINNLKPSFREPIVLTVQFSQRDWLFDREFF